MKHPEMEHQEMAQSIKNLQQHQEVMMQVIAGLHQQLKTVTASESNMNTAAEAVPNQMRTGCIVAAPAT